MDQEEYLDSFPIGYVQNMDEEEYLNCFPIGYLFVPTDKELLYYLNKKLSNSPLPPNRIRDVIDLYNIHPHQLTSIYKLPRAAYGEKVWYFFTNRCESLQHGFWKAICSDNAKEILDRQGTKLGTKLTLEGIAEDENGIKTEWIMNEYRSADVPIEKTMDEWVLCAMYKRIPTLVKPTSTQEVEEEEEEEEGEGCK